MTEKPNIEQGTMEQLLTGKKRLPGFSGEWKFKKLGNYITDFRGGAPLTPNDFTETGIKVLPKGGVTRGGFLKIQDDKLQYCSFQYADKHKSNIVDKTYTIVVLRDLVPSGPTIGLMVKINSNDLFVLAQGVYGFKVKQEEIDVDFLIQMSNGFKYRSLMNDIMVGSTQVHITNTAFLRLQLPFPPSVEEQKAIAQALSDVDAAIAELDRLITKKRNIKQGTMQQLLTGKKRLAGFSGEWKFKKLGNYITDFRGGAPLTPNDFTEIGIKVLPKGGVTRGGFLKIQDDKLQYCSLQYADKHKSNIVDKTYTIVVLRDLVPSGPSIGLMVKINSSDLFVLAQGVYGFKVKQEEIDVDFLIQMSNGFKYRSLMNDIMVGSTQVHITNTAFLKLELPFPPSVEEQKAIAQVLSDMDTEIEALEQKRNKYKAIKQGMMQELLTGRTRLI